MAIFYGPVINPESLSSFRSLPRCLLAVDASGEIVWIEEHVPESALEDVLAQHGTDKIRPHILKHGEFLLPGFVDTHTVRTHPSHATCGCGLEFTDDGWPSIARTPVPQSQVGVFCMRFNVVLTRPLHYQRSAVRTTRLAKRSNVPYGDSIWEGGVRFSSV